MPTVIPTVHGLNSPAFSDRPTSARALAYSALNEFDKLGFHAASTRSICTQAGMSTGALYAHFRSKEQILYWWVDLGHSRGLEVIEEAYESEGPAISRLTQLVRNFTELCTKNPTMTRVVERELTSLDQEYMDQILVKRRRMNQLTTSLIEQGIAEGSLTPSDVRVATLTVLTYTQTIIRWYGTAAPYDEAKLTDSLCEAILRVCGAHDV